MMHLIFKTVVSFQYMSYEISSPWKFVLMHFLQVFSSPCMYLISSLIGSVFSFWNSRHFRNGFLFVYCHAPVSHFHEIPINVHHHYCNTDRHQAIFSLALANQSGWYCKKKWSSLTAASHVFCGLKWSRA